MLYLCSRPAMSLKLRHTQILTIMKELSNSQKTKLNFPIASPLIHTKRPTLPLTIYIKTTSHLQITPHTKAPYATSKNILLNMIVHILQNQLHKHSLTLINGLVMKTLTLKPLQTFETTPLSQMCKKRTSSNFDIINIWAMHASNYSLVQNYTQRYHVPYATHQNQTLGNISYYLINNTIFTHYVLNTIIKSIIHLNKFRMRVHSIIAPLKIRSHHGYYHALI